MLNNKQEARRRVLKSGLGYAITSLRIPLAAPITFSLLAPRTANAVPVTAVIAIATAVAGMAASQNQSDGGIGAQFKASLEYQRIMVGQITALQAAMAHVIDKLNRIEGEIESIITKESLKQVQAKIDVAIDSYRQQVDISSVASSYQAWAENRDVRDKLKQIRDKLDDAISTIIARQWIDPLTVVYFISAIFASLSVSSVLDKNSPEIIRIRGRDYLTKLSRFDDTDSIDSIFSKLQKHSAICSALFDQLNKQYGYNAPADDSTRSDEVLLNEVVIQDFTPSYDIPHFGNGPAPKDRVGPSENFEYISRVSRTYVQSDPIQGVSSVALRQLSVDNLVITRRPTPGAGPRRPPQRITVSGVSLPGLPSIPSFTLALPPPIEKIQVDARTPAERESAANSGSSYATAVEARKTLSQTIDLINQETAQVALCGNGLAVVAKARRGLLRFFGVAS
ncbi:hypothetical protein [Cupriavidus pinatubonensis]|uniref:hypothetical protein n=1 Tax=Cupriavidus pinatubonensis TaxID=248026 RepID=UPI00112B4E7B|nr:hypothetical protein [Cupriavidus pinatubonensis]